MSPRNVIALLSVTAFLTGCSLPRLGTGTPQVSAGYHPGGKSTVWPAPGGNAATCTPSGPAGDKPTPRVPTADTLVVRSRTLRQAFATLCSFSVPVPKTINGTSRAPLQ